MNAAMAFSSEMRPVRVKKTRYNKSIKPGSDLIRAGLQPLVLACREDHISLVERLDLPGRLRRLTAPVARWLIGDARVMRAIGQPVQRLATAEKEFRAGGIADRPVAGGFIEFDQ
jgi:hypothetical protein